MARIASVLQTQDRGKKNLALPAFQISCRWSREKNKANVVEDLEESLGKGLLSWASWDLQTFRGYFRTRLNPVFLHTAGAETVNVWFQQHSRSIDRIYFLPKDCERNRSLPQCGLRPRKALTFMGDFWVRWNYIYVTLVGWIKSQGRHQPTKPSDICQRNGSQC